MKMIIIPLALIISFNSVGQTIKPDSVEMNNKLTYFLKLTDTLRSIGRNSGMAMAIVYDNKLVHKGGAGFRDVEKKLPVTESTLFEIGSCTKAFTGVLASQLVNEGIINWDDKVIKHLKEFKLQDDYATRNATIKDLFTHRTGMDQHYYLMYGPKFSRNDILNRIRYLSFNGSFREKFLYNNLMYVVGGIVEERVTESSWEDMIKNRIFKPLGMKNSFATFSEFEQYPENTLSYKNDGVTIVPPSSLDTYAPAGSITSTITDMAIWLQMLVNKGKSNNKEFITPKQFAYLTSPLTVRNPTEEIFYGVGWDIDTRRKIIYHDGRTGGQSSRILIIPEKGFGIVIMCNQQTDLQNLLIRYATNIFVENNYERLNDFEDFIKNKANPAKLAPQIMSANSHADLTIRDWKGYAGQYINPAYGTLNLSGTDGNNVTFQYYGFKGMVKHFKNSKFKAFTEHFTGKDQFDFNVVKNTKGVVVGIEVLFPYSAPVFFKKS